MLAEGTEPAQQMGIAVQLGEFVQVGKGSVEISKKVAGAVAIVCHGVRPESSGEELEVGLEVLVEVWA